MAFLVEDQVLGDSNQRVRSGMLSAASKVVDLHGSRHIADLTTMFEKHISTNTDGSEASDYVKEAVVILLGRIARHMEIGDARIPSVVSRLTEALKTPSEQVQVAVSECLAPLVAFVKGDVDRLVDDLLLQLFQGQKYGERRGAAYGLAGIVKGAGISSITDFNILERLKTALEDKKRYEARQGAMFAIETFSATLERNFEPYIIELLPSLLASFGDASADVREATEDAAKVIMGNMSGYGVKRILPSLLSALDEKQWRTKKGSIELLGTMAFCAPKQLSVSLPTVIPRLSGVLTDSHAQVRTSANKSLKQFGEVINNPEIQSLVPTLLKALGDPARTPGAMTSLLKKSFAHYIDSASLALVRTSLYFIVSDSFNACVRSSLLSKGASGREDRIQNGRRHKLLAISRLSQIRKTSFLTYLDSCLSCMRFWLTRSPRLVPQLRRHWEHLWSASAKNSSQTWFRTS